MLTRRTLGLGGLGLVLLLTAFGYWWTGGDVTAWWRLRNLAAANDANRAECAERLAELDARGLPGMLGLLRSADLATCQNARAGLVCLSQRWGPDDARLAEMVAQRFTGLSAIGQVAVLTLPPETQVTGAEAVAPAVRTAWATTLAAVPEAASDEVRAASLDLTGWLLTSSTVADMLPTARERVRAALSAQSPALRSRAAELALIPGINLFEEVAALLRDPATEVRRAALLVVGPADKVVTDEALLACLRDPDKEVRRLCEEALRNRGVTGDQIKLCRLLTDPSPLERLKVLDHLARSPDLEPAVWLRRLSHDPADSVRAAAVRVMAQQPGSDLADRLEQIRMSDPSPSVSELAAFYLGQSRGRRE